LQSCVSIPIVDSATEGGTPCTVFSRNIALPEELVRGGCDYPRSGKRTIMNPVPGNDTDSASVLRQPPWPGGPRAALVGPPDSRLERAQEWPSNWIARGCSSGRVHSVSPVILPKPVRPRGPAAEPRPARPALRQRRDCPTKPQRPTAPPSGDPQPESL